MAELAKKQSDSLQEFMDKVEEFINQEENLRELRLSRQVPVLANKVIEKKKKKYQEVQGASNSKVHKKFGDYNFTHLNTVVIEVLWRYRRILISSLPQRYWGNHRRRTSTSIVLYHKANSHSIKGCISPRLLIEKFMGNRKLIRFLIDQKGLQDQNRDRQPWQYPPRDD